MVMAVLTPQDWEISIIDENLGVPDYMNMPAPDLVGITAFSSQVGRAYELAREFRTRGVPKKWITQVTINMADDEDLLALAAKAGCCGVFIGFEAIDEDGLIEVGKRYNLTQAGDRRDFRDSVRRIRRHGILVAGSFVMSLCFMSSREMGFSRRRSATTAKSCKSSMSF